MFLKKNSHRHTKLQHLSPLCHGQNQRRRSEPPPTPSAVSRRRKGSSTEFFRRRRRSFFNVFGTSQSQTFRSILGTPVGKKLATMVGKSPRPGVVHRTTWRIIPFSKWLITIVSKSPKWGYSPSTWPKRLINRGY